MDKRYKNKVNAVFRTDRMVKDDDSFLRTYCLCCKSRTIYKSKIITQVFY
jgi:hypothetical protein